MPRVTPKTVMGDELEDPVAAAPPSELVHDASYSDTTGNAEGALAVTVSVALLFAVTDGVLAVTVAI